MREARTGEPEQADGQVAGQAGVVVERVCVHVCVRASCVGVGAGVSGACEWAAGRGVDVAGGPAAHGCVRYHLRQLFLRRLRTGEG